MCKFCGCAWGRAQHGLLFLEIIGDLLEKQETLGLLVCILTFLFLFSNFFHRSQVWDVFRVLVVNSDLQAPSSLLPTLPPPAAHPLFVSVSLSLCPLLPHSQSLLWGAGRSLEPWKQVLCLSDAVTWRCRGTSFCGVGLPCTCVHPTPCLRSSHLYHRG